MKQYFLRRHTWIFLAVILLAGIVPAFSLLHSGIGTKARAQGTPTVTSSATTVHYGDIITVTAQGFAAGETVQLQLEDTYTNIWGDGTLTCDSNGTCVGPTSITNSCAGGAYTLIAIGETSQLKATTPLTINPKLNISSGRLPEGGPGAQIDVEGDGFARGESNVFVYWGTSQGINEGLGSVDDCGSLFFQFNAPTTLTPGTYLITVTRKNMKPALLVAKFHVLPPTIVATPTSITPGQSIQVQLQGFSNGEQVSISWNANGGQQVAATGVGYNGAVLTTVTPQAAPHATYTLRAHGKTSGLQATTTLAIGPGIQVTPVPVNPGSTVTVTGGGFAASETIDVYFQSASSGGSNITADATGSFTTSLVLPSTYNPNLPYFVHAKSVSGTNQASARIVFMTPTLNFTWFGSTYNQQVSLAGQGFAANEPVKLYWNYKQVGQILVTTSIANSGGTVSFTLNIPSDPDLNNVLVAAVGKTSGLSAIISTPEQAAVIINPISGPPGTTIQISGGGFGSFDQVMVFFNGVVVSTHTADVRGAFTATYKVPSKTPTGVYNVGAYGKFSNVGVNTPFTVPPLVSINPTTGSSGTKITISGSKFSPSSGVNISWYDPNSGLNYLTSVTTTVTGTFTVTITAPSNLISGTIYYIEAYDGQTGAIGEAQFTAQ